MTKSGESHHMSFVFISGVVWYLLGSVVFFSIKSFMVFKRVSFISSLWQYILQKAPWETRGFKLSSKFSSVFRVLHGLPLTLDSAWFNGVRDLRFSDIFSFGVIYVSSLVSVCCMSREIKSFEVWAIFKLLFFGPPIHSVVSRGARSISQWCTQAGGFLYHRLIQCCAMPPPPPNLSVPSSFWFHEFLLYV